MRRTKAQPHHAHRQSCHSWIRTTIHGFRGRCPAVRRNGIECGRRESNAQAATFEEARSAGLPSLPRAPPGSRTPFLRVRAGCITSHACSAKSLTGESNPARQFGGLAHHRNACKARCPPQESNLHPLGFNRVLCLLS
jgi:hypothetical protein